LALQMPLYSATSCQQSLSHYCHAIKSSSKALGPAAKQKPAF
jgi:hypothetical protein